ncbi:MAG: class I SAM-dependent methyltransferase [Dokdonella sp.]
MFYRAAPRQVWANGDGEPSQYEWRAQQEVSRFSEEEVINDLPEIFNYWSNTHLRPRLEHFGYSYPEDFFARRIEQQAKGFDRTIKVISIGAGNCDSEVAVAKLLLERGVDRFHFDCLDLTPAMLERGRQLANANGLDQHFGFIAADFNQWKPHETYDVVVANQSLHHVTNLEGLFDAVHTAIGEQGIFVVSDMIGRNGHMRWPEALTIVQQFWKELPKAYRYNRQLRRQEKKFGNWDCAGEGFEGIRAQDILPLMVERFGFDFFLGYGNLVDPFIDRGFGPNFDAEKDWDRNFIDRVHARDEDEILAGRIQPTHMLAVLRRDKSAQPVVWKHLTPKFSVRHV